MSPSSRIRSALAFALVLALAACGGGGGGSASDDGSSAAPVLTVMTRNLYLGADLAPLFAATADDLVTVARATYDQVLASDIDGRLDAVAGEIAIARPDLVALQEATIWSEQAAGASAPTVKYDYVTILLEDLARHGVSYTVASTVDGFSGGLPVEGVGLVTMQDRDVILVRDDAGVRVANPRSDSFTTHLTVDIAGAAIDVVRGWTSVEATKEGRQIRLVATHLEAFDDAVRDAQLQELLALLEDDSSPQLLLGDLNSAASGTGSSAYDAALAAGLDDVWESATPGFTCCRDADLLGGDLSQRIDYVLTDGDLQPRDADVVGTDDTSQTPTGQWSSDHAGVVATIALGD